MIPDSVEGQSGFFFGEWGIAMRAPQCMFSCARKIGRDRTCPAGIVLQPEQTTEPIGPLVI